MSRSPRRRGDESPPPDPVRPEHDLRTAAMRRGYKPKKAKRRSSSRERSRDRSRSRSRKKKKRSHKKLSRRDSRSRSKSRSRGRSGRKGEARDESPEPWIGGKGRNENPGQLGEDKEGRRSRSPSVDRFGRIRRPGEPRSPSASSLESRRSRMSLGRSRSRDRSRSPKRSPRRSASPGPDRPRWSRDRFKEVEDTGDDSPPRFVPKDYVPPAPTWKSKAGGVYIPLKPS